MRAFVLAGGFATRLWPLTEKRAKPLLPLAGKPLLAHIIDALPEGMHITISTNDAFGDAFQEWGAQQQRPMDIVVEEARSDSQKRGALGALAEWIESAKPTEDILVLTGDNYFGFPLASFVQQYNGHPLIAASDIKDLSKATSFGTILLSEDGKTVAGFEEKPKEPKTTLISTGATIIPPSAFDVVLEHAAKKPDDIGGLFEALLQAGHRIECSAFDETWYDIGSFAAYIDASKTLLREPHIHPSASVERSQLEGAIAIGERSTIKESELKDVVVFEDCDITDCVIERCVIDAGCRLRGVDLRDKMIRAGTVLIAPH